MTLTKEDLDKAKQAWENIAKQAKIDSDQAEMYLEIIMQKLEGLKNGNNK